VLSRGSSITPNRRASRDLADARRVYALDAFSRGASVAAFVASLLAVARRGATVGASTSAIVGRRNGQYDTVTGGDSAEDPYLDRR